MTLSQTQAGRPSSPVYTLWVLRCVTLKDAEYWAVYGKYILFSSTPAPVGQRDGDLICLFLSPAAMSIFLFLCLAVEPRASQCACEIHTQQSLYLEALGMLMGSMHDNCDCTCRWCEGGEGCKTWLGMCRSLHNFSDELMCEKVDMLGEDKEDEFEHWGRRPECVAGKCSNCGFGNLNGIPTDCLALGRAAHKMVGWIRFQDQEMEDGKTHKKQQLPQVRPLRDLWDEFMEHSEKVNLSTQ